MHVKLQLCVKLFFFLLRSEQKSAGLVQLIFLVKEDRVCLVGKRAEENDGLHPV